MKNRRKEKGHGTMEVGERKKGKMTERRRRTKRDGRNEEEKKKEGEEGRVAYFPC